MIQLFKLFIRLFLYKFLLFNLNLFKQFLFEKHFYLFNKFIALYGPSSVSTEFRKVVFSKENDINDELLGDSNYFLNSKLFLNYLKNDSRLKFNLLNFNYLLKFRQYNRSLFFIKYSKIFLKKDFTIFNKKCLNNRISLKEVILEKIKINYINKSIFSYICLFFEFLQILLSVFLFNLLRKKKFVHIYDKLITKENIINLNQYYKLRMSIFAEFILIKKELNKYFFFKFLLIKLIKLIDCICLFFFKIFTIFTFVQVSLFISLFIYLFIFKIMFVFKKLINFAFFFKFVSKFKDIKIYFFFSRFYKFIYIFFKLIDFLLINLFLRFKFFIIYKIYYFYKNKMFYTFIYSFIMKRNIAYLNLIAILFTIKKDLKRRYTVLLSQTRTRQKSDLRDLNFYEYINNVLPEEKNKDFFFFFANKYKKKKKYLFFDKSLFFLNKIIRRKNFKKFNFIKINSMNKKFIQKKILSQNNLKNYYYISFFSKYLYNLSVWSFLFKMEKSKSLSYFLLRKLFFYKQFKILYLRKNLFFIELNNFFKIKYFRLSNNFKFCLNNFISFLNLNIKKKKRKRKLRRYIKFSKVNKKILIKVYYTIKKKRIFSFKISKKNPFFKKIFFKKILTFKKYKKKKKKIKLLFSLNFFIEKKINFTQNLFLLKNYVIIKIKQKKRIKKLKHLRRKYLKLSLYKMLRKRKKINFINFFEQSEKYLNNQKKFSLHMSKYKMGGDLSWFSNLHNYTFFHKYFILKRDRFWYAVARRESLLKYHDGRNMMTDSWDENFLLQQRSLMFFKEGYQTLLIGRTNFNTLSCLDFLQVIENSVLKKHDFLIFIWKCFFICIFIYMYIYLLIYSLNTYILLLSFIILGSMLPFIIVSLYKLCLKRYRLQRTFLLVYLRKYYMKKNNIFFFYKWFNYYITDLFFFKFFLKKNKLNFFMFSFFGKKILDRIKYIEKKKSFLIIIYRIISNIMMFICFIYFICFFQVIINFLLYYYFSQFISYYIFTLFDNIIIISILFYSFYLFFNSIIFYFNFINIRVLKFIVKFYFDNNFVNFVIFLNKFFFKQYSFKNLRIDNINEQLFILNNVKAQQYINSYNKLKKNAI